MKRQVLVLTAMVIMFAVAGAAKANNTLVTPQGGFCIDAKGGARIGAELVIWDCHGGTNQLFRFEKGRLVAGGYCAQADSRHERAGIRLAQCNFSDAGNALQNFAPSGNGVISHNSGWVIQNGYGFHKGRGVMLGAPHPVEKHKQWEWGSMVKTNRFKEGGTYKIPGIEGSFTFRGGSLISDGGGTYTVRGGDLVGPDGGTLIRAGGSIVAAGAGNLVGK